MNNEIKKLKYESPKILDLGEMGKGVGICTSGSSNTLGDCESAGSTASNPPCQNGNNNSGDTCSSNGGSATGSSQCNSGTGNTGSGCDMGPSFFP